MTGSEGLPGVPEHMLGMSRRALDLHDPSLPVAHLAADSLLDPDLPLPPGADRRLLFEHADLGVDVVLRVTPAMRLDVRVVREASPHDPAAGGHGLVPAGHDFAEIVRPAERAKICLVSGEGTLPDVRAGLTCLVLYGGDGVQPRSFRTAWFTV